VLYYFLGGGDQESPVSAPYHACFSVVKNSYLQNVGIKMMQKLHKKICHLQRVIQHPAVEVIILELIDWLLTVCIAYR